MGGQSNPTVDDNQAPLARQPKIWNRADYVAMACCVALAVLLAAAPHLATLGKLHTAEYVANIDEVLYLDIGRTLYNGENTMRDPLAPAAQRQGVPINVCMGAVRALGKVDGGARRSRRAHELSLAGRGRLPPGRDSLSFVFVG